MKYYFKQPLFIIVYTFIFSLLGFGLAALDIEWLQIAGGIGIVAFYCVVTWILFYIEGRESYKALHANDLDRIQIVKTGDDIYINTHKEYKPYKGFLMGAMGCAPAIIIAIIYLIVTLASGGIHTEASKGVGSTLTVCYSCFWLLVTGFGGIDFRNGIEGTNPAMKLISLYCVPITILVAGVAYIIGGVRQRQIYEIARQTHDKIYGDQKPELADGEEDYSQFQDYTQELPKKGKNKEGKK